MPKQARLSISSILGHVLPSSDNPVRFRVEFAASVPKDATTPALNEDAWAHDDTMTCVALSDGASESFDSKSWARLLVDRYVNDQRFDTDWVSQAVKGYVSQVDFDSLGWAQQRAFDRGSFATLLGLTLAENDVDLDVLSVGDSLAIHVRDGIVLDTYPFTHPEQFNARPKLVSTKSSSNAFLAEPGFFGTCSKTWTVQPGDVIFAATDAVGQWFLSQMHAETNVLDTLAEAMSDVDFSMLVERLRAEHQMKLDDSTLVRLLVEKNGT
jgi:hypothetical protein